MEPIPIPSSLYDLERRRLENTIDHDLASLSLSSLNTTSSSSQAYRGHAQTATQTFITSSSDFSLEYPRAESIGISAQHITGVGYGHGHGPAGTPRATGRTSSRQGSIRDQQSLFVGASPVSTAGHHASNMTLGAGVFKTRAARYGEKENNPETEEDFDPERSLGKLKGELGRVMKQSKIPSRPSSPFSPRSPSPLPSSNNQPLNLSLTASRNEQLLSPPTSNENTAKIGQSIKSYAEGASHFSSLAEQIGKDIQARRNCLVTAQNPRTQTKKPLAVSNSHNIPVSRTPGPIKPIIKEKNDRVRALQAEGKRFASAPVKRSKDTSADITGLTALLATPAKGMKFGSLGKDENIGVEPTVNIPQTLATLHARLRALEMENSVSRRRVKELEEELEKTRQEVETAKTKGEHDLREAIGEKSALEALVESLRANLSRLTLELAQHKEIVIELRHAATVGNDAEAGSSSPSSSSVRDELVSLRQKIERLTQEVEKLGGIVEEGLETQKRARGERTMRMEKEDMESVIKQVVEQERNNKGTQNQDQVACVQHFEEDQLSKQQQALTDVVEDAAIPNILNALQNQTCDLSRNYSNPTTPLTDDGYDSPTPFSRPGSRQSPRSPVAQLVRPKSRGRRERSKLTYQDRSGGPGSPFPSIVGKELEKEFFSPLPKDKKHQKLANIHKTKKKRFSADGLPPQTVLTRVIAELEDDFAHYKSIYSELADQYKVLDPASVVSKRHVLAEHLREVIDTLEIKADQISDLYNLLTFKDKPIPLDGMARQTDKGKRSVGDVIRMVKESLGNEMWQRLQDDLKR
ncbi:uncharacterized protein L203_100585 [Cryptococcus depauperatus CBS 7841]|uniref:Cep57 centrosome microtubule-binding domain-containing protein n=1 Tax=Cryptococcus depauperatus CBS 7841 TaxID=1295531 RepID=A0AAJ8JND4_9TREE